MEFIYFIEVLLTIFTSIIEINNDTTTLFKNILKTLSFVNFKYNNNQKGSGLAMLAGKLGGKIKGLKKADGKMPQMGAPEKGVDKGEAAKKSFKKSMKSDSRSLRGLKTIDEIRAESKEYGKRRNLYNLIEVVAQIMSLFLIVFAPFYYTTKNIFNKTIPAFKDMVKGF